MPALDPESRCAAAMLGLALGDALGAPHEGGGFAWMIRRAMGDPADDLLRWTDDTEMALVLAESLAERSGVEADELALRWAKAADPGRGYGEGALKLLELVKQGVDWRTANRAVFPEGSFGNGAAMRAAPIGLFYAHDETKLRSAAESAARVTHAHPLGIEGGVLIARAAALALREPFEPDIFLKELEAGCASAEFRRRFAIARGLLALGDKVSSGRAASLLGNEVVAHKSAVTAVYAFCRFPGDFEGLLSWIIALGGDTDTIAAMAGGLFGARNGLLSLPETALRKLESRDRIEAAGRELHRRRP